MKTGIKQIAEERQKQIEKYGFTGKHHYCHPEWYENNQLTWAAIQLFANDFGYSNSREDVPENWDKERFLKMQSKSYKERLVIAAALIAAEIDRLQASEGGI